MWRTVEDDSVLLLADGVTSAGTVKCPTPRIDAL
jgi:hypothetical protein